MQIVYHDTMRATLGWPTSRQTAVSLIGGCVTREKILRLESALIETLKAQGKDFTVGNTDEDAPLIHHFAPGLYAREIFLPKGLIIIGKIHRHAHVNTISKGHVIVATEFGTEELKALTRGYLNPVSSGLLLLWKIPSGQPITRPMKRTS